MPAHLQIKRWQACRASESCRETRLEGVLHRAGSELAVIAEAEAAGAAEVDIDAGLQRHRVACDRHAEHGEAVAVVERKPRRRRIREGMAPAERGARLEARAADDDLLRDPRAKRGECGVAAEAARRQGRRAAVLGEAV